MKPMRYIASALLALLTSATAVAGPNDSCTTEEKTATFLPSTAGFLDAVKMQNALVAQSDTGRLDPTVKDWKIVPSAVAFVAVQSKKKRCDSDQSKFNCTQEGCNESIPGTEHYGVGAELSVSSCGPNAYGSFSYTTLLWVKQGDGSWTMTTRTSELRVSCDPT